MNESMSRMHSAQYILSEPRWCVFGSFSEPCLTMIESIISVRLINLSMLLQYTWGSLASMNSKTSCCVYISCTIYIPTYSIIFSLRFSSFWSIVSNIFHCSALTVDGPWSELGLQGRYAVITVSFVLLYPPYVTVGHLSSGNESSSNDIIAGDN